MNGYDILLGAVFSNGTSGGGTPSASDTTYIYSQNTSSQSWVINHNLNKYPSVTVVDSAETVIIGQVKYISSNSLSIDFSSGFSGKAYLN